MAASFPGSPLRASRFGSIADMTGFASLSDFCRWFHDRFGVGPTTWRREFVAKLPKHRRCRTCEGGPVEPDVKRAHVNGMTYLRFNPFAAVAAMLAAIFLTACASSGTPQDGRYQTHGGGRDNFRAEAPAFPEPIRLS